MSSRITQAEISTGVDGWTCIAAPYDPDFVDAIKRRIPAWWRRWEPDAKAWHVAPHQRDLAVSICRAYYDRVTVDSSRRPAPDPTGGRVIDPDAATLYLLPNAPPEVITAARNALAKLYHPDLHPGDPTATERMRAVNVAYERLVARVGGRG